MRMQKQAMGHCSGVLRILFTLILFSLGSPANSWAQSNGSDIQLKVASPEANGLSVASSEGLPERGRFQFRYSYSGKSIDADIILHKNGSEVARKSGLSAVSNELLGDFSVQKGDVIVISTTFRGSGNSATLGPSNIFGHPAGLWYSYGSGSFYSIDQEGNIIEVFGNWNFSLTLTPPWNGITVKAQPSQLSPGGTSNISLQPYETPSDPVIIPDHTYINLQTNFLGDLVGGLGLPKYGLRYMQGFANAPWGLLKGTDKVFEVLPDSLLSVQFDSLQVPVVAYSPYNIGVNGSTSIVVTKEKTELEISYVNSEEIEIWPTLGGGAFSGRNKNENNIQKEIIVEVTWDGEPEPNKEVVVLSRFIPKTGGHDHSGQPSGSLRGEIKFHNVPITDCDGKVQFIYKAPKISGEYELIAQVAENGIIYDDSKSVIVKVPGLDPLVDSPYFEKVGAPNNNETTNDPCREPESLTSVHYDNHYGTNELNSDIRAISKDYFVVDNQIKLRINDLSLEWGGIFDIDNEWTDPHFEHRIGKQADIGMKGMPNQSGLSECPQISEDIIVPIIERHTSAKLLIHRGSKPHYHIRNL